jgi:hypothetical protein
VELNRCRRHHRHAQAFLRVRVCPIGGIATIGGIAAIRIAAIRIAAIRIAAIRIAAIGGIAAIGIAPAIEIRAPCSPSRHTCKAQRR